MQLRNGNQGWRTPAGGSLLFLLVLLAAGFALYGQAKKPVKPRPKARTTKASTVRRTVRKPVRRAPVRRARVAAPVAVPAAAEIPTVTETAAVWQGCAAPADLPDLAGRLQVEADHLRSVLSERELLPSDETKPCLPYVGATGGAQGAATAVFHAGDAPAVIVSRTADSLAVAGRELRFAESPRRTVSFSSRDYAERPVDVLDGVPESIQWQLKVLVPRMTPAEGAHNVRVTIGEDPETGRERLYGVEIAEAESGKLVDGAWWLDRKDGPGVIVGMKGTAYERMLWLAPIDYIRKARGTGPTTRVVRRNFAAPQGGRRTRSVRVSGFHLGADLTAPTGTPIHTVGDGVVSFAGRRGGYGNLVIVDHGRGYQTYYAHLSKFEPGVRVGTAVSRGEVIGRVGSTGRSTAPHLHFETRKDSRYIDPYDESRQLDFWLLSPEEHAELGVRVLSGAPAVPAAAGGGN